MQDTTVRTKTNHAVIGEAFSILLTEAFAPYVGMELNREYGTSWWTEAVLRNLEASVTSNLPRYGTYNQLLDSLDISACLSLLTGKLWSEVFRKRLPKEEKIWAEELRNTRNRWAHQGGRDFSDDDTDRALDTMSRFAEQMDGDTADKLRAMLREYRYGSAGGSAGGSDTMGDGAKTKDVERAKDGALKDLPDKSFKSWRDVMQPHPDVAEGRYRSAEFAADLNQVARGNAAQEYQDPVEFFSRTYLTDGMRGLLKEAVQRISGTGGEPIIQLKTAFGGGKTHSMLALYHLFNGRSPGQVTALRELIEETGVGELPRTNVVSIVGTSFDPASYTLPADLPGVRVNTIWGEIAAQLARATGRPELYDYVRAADRRGVSPGSVALQEMLDDAGPTLILMDELVAYAKKLPNSATLPAGTLDNFITFIQELTEAAKASRNAVVVASIPESDIEIGGEAGQAVLSQIQHTFGRTESVWKPVAAQEGFEIVRRRLFLDCTDPEARDAVCDAFAQMYADNEQNYPIDARQPSFKERLKASYPIHPEMFDRLYEDWSTLDRFQRTRGVLRLMAAVIHQLWMGQDQGLLIMPGSLPLNTPAVRDELTRYLPDAWNPIVDKEVDGDHSVPYEVEQAQPRYAQSMAARRVARTVMLGSAPTDESQRVRGLDRQHIRLGTVQPGEPEVLFDDALRTISKRMSYLYEDSSGDRFWLDSQPTLRKTAADKAAALKPEQVSDEIVRRLKKVRKEDPFGAVHVAPKSSVDVEDKQQVGLVVLPPDKTYLRKHDDNDAIQFAQDILDHRGSNPRLHRNMLVFVAPDELQIPNLDSSVRSFLAWQSIYDTREELGLTPARTKEAKRNLDEAEQSVQSLLGETYRWVLIPESADDALGKVQWSAEQAPNVASGTNALVRNVADLMGRYDKIVSQWAPQFLQKALNERLWNGRTEVPIQQLWDYFTQYLYLPRLTGQSVLLRALEQGIVDHSLDLAYADDIRDGQYVGLAYEDKSGRVNMAGYVVQREAAKQQQPVIIKPVTDGPSTETETVDPPPKPPVPKSTQFTLSADLDDSQMERQVAQLNEEIVRVLKSVPGTQFRISLDIEADCDDGFPEDLRDDVLANCRAIGVRYSGFNESREP